MRNFILGLVGSMVVAGAAGCGKSSSSPDGGGGASGSVAGANGGSPRRRGGRERRRRRAWRHRRYRRRHRGVRVRLHLHDRRLVGPGLERQDDADAPELVSLPGRYRHPVRRRAGVPVLRSADAGLQRSGANRRQRRRGRGGECGRAGRFRDDDGASLRRDRDDRPLPHLRRQPVRRAWNDRRRRLPDARGQLHADTDRDQRRSSLCWMRWCCSSGRIPPAPASTSAQGRASERSNCARSEADILSGRVSATAATAHCWAFRASEVPHA